MLFGLFGKKQNRCLGIDFGASGIKIAELGRDEKNRLILQNYILGQTKIDSKFSIAKLDADDTAKILKGLLDKAGIFTSQAVISLSVGETFSTIIDLPYMPEADLAKAIPFQAQKYVPVPIDEVVLDWSVVGEFQAPAKEKIDLSASENKEAQAPVFPSPPKKIQVLIVVVPKELIKKIAQIAKKINLKILAIEQEAFSIVRSLVGNDEESFLIIDLGQKDIDFILVDKNSIRFTYTFPIEKKPDLIFEAAKLIDLCQTRYNKKVAKIILTGGRAERGLSQAEPLLSGTSPGGGAGREDFAGAFFNKLKIPTGIGDPFARLNFDQKLTPCLKEIAPFLAVAIGAAMREL